MAFTIDIGNLLAHLNLDAKQFDKSIRMAELRMRSAAEKMGRMGRMMSMRVTLPLVALGATAVKSLGNFQEQMAFVSTMLDEQSMYLMPKYAQAIKKMSVEFGEGTATITDGLYKVLSATIEPTKAINFLSVAMKTARAGMTNTGIAAYTITGLLNAYGYSADRAQEVSDIMFATIKRGQTTFNELAPTIGRVASIAAVAGVPLEEIAAALATITRAGISTDQAVTFLRSSLIALQGKGQDNIRMAKKFGIELSTAGLRADGLAGMIEKINQLSEEQVKNIFTDIRSRQALVVLLKQHEGFINDIALAYDSAGLTQEAYAKMTENINHQLRQFWSLVKVVTVELGDRLRPTFEKLNEYGTKLLKWWRSLNDATKDFIAEMALLTAAVGPALLLMSSLLKTIILIKVAMYAAAGAATTMATALTLVGTAIASWRIGKWMRENFEWFAIWSEKLAETITALGIHIVFAFKDASLKVKMYWNKVMNWLRQEWADFIMDLAKGVSKIEDVTGQQLGGALGALVEYHKSITDTIEDTTAHYENAIEDNVNEYYEQLRRLVEITDQAIENIKENFREGTSASDEFAQQAQKIADEWLAAENVMPEFDIEPPEEKLSFIEEHMTSFHTYLSNAADGWERLGEIGAGAMDGLADSIATMAETGKANFKQLAVSVLQELNRMIIKMILAKALMSALGLSPVAVGAPMGGAGGAVAPTVTPSALGRLFSLGNIVPFQLGGVVPRPMLAPMALMGERGPEAVMPLKRTPGGELGVRAEQTETVLNVKNVNVFDRSEIVGAMDSDEGEKVILNIMRRKGLM